MATSNAATGASVGTVFGPWGTVIGAGVGAALDIFAPKKQETTEQTTGTSSKQRVLSQPAIDKLIYDMLSADQGLASLASGENLSGGFNSSTKTLQTQDFLTKLIGELALISSPEVTTAEQEKKTSSKSGGTVICTELAKQGLLDPELYEAGGPASTQVSYTTWVGYHSWATHVVSRMKRSSRLSHSLLPVVESRYRYLTGAPGIHLLGRVTVWVGHPICYLIGSLINLRGAYGRASEFA